MEHRSKTRLLSAMLIAVVFGAGVLIGFAADSTLDAEIAETASEQTGEDEGRERPRRTPLYAQLDPTPEEQALIDSIVSVHRDRTNALDKETRAAYRSGFREILLETRDAIRGILPQDKSDEYQRLLDEWDARQAAEREEDRGRRR